MGLEYKQKDGALLTKPKLIFSRSRPKKVFAPDLNPKDSPISSNKGKKAPNRANKKEKDRAILP